MGGSAGEGITSGLAPRQGYNTGLSVKPIDFPGTQAEWEAQQKMLKEKRIGPHSEFSLAKKNKQAIVPGNTGSTGSNFVGGGTGTNTQSIMDAVTQRKNILDAMYPRQKTDSMAGANFLMNWGVDLASRPRSGNIFQQAATSAKDPLLRFQEEKLMEQAAAAKETSEDRALLAKMLEGMDDDKLSALMKDVKAGVDAGLWTENEGIKKLLQKKVYGVLDEPGEAENARIRELELMISRDQEVPAGAIRSVAEHIYKIETGAYPKDIQTDLNRTKTYIKPNHIIGTKKDEDGNIIEIIVDGKQSRSYVKNQIYFDPGTGELFKNVGKEGEAPRFVKVIFD
jgi:hypothetical protein